MEARQEVAARQEVGAALPNPASCDKCRRRYLCKICGVERSKRCLMERHIEFRHPNDLVQIGVIGKDRRRYVCGICGVAWSKLCLYRKHVHSHSSEMGFSAHSAMETREEVGGVPRNLAACDESRRRYVCKICGIQRSKRCHLHRHMENCHPDDRLQTGVIGKDRTRYVSGICKTLLSKLSLHREHAHSHCSEVGLSAHPAVETREEVGGVPSNPASCDKPRRRYLCKICGLERSKRSLIERHMDVRHPNDRLQIGVIGKDRRRYVCGICKTVQSKLSLHRMHVHSHYSELSTHCETEDHIPPQGTRKRKRYSCEECGAAMKKPSLLLQHMFCHSNQLIWICLRKPVLFCS